MKTACKQKLLAYENCLLVKNCLLVNTACLWKLLAHEHCLLMKTACSWKLLAGEKLLADANWLKIIFNDRTWNQTQIHGITLDNRETFIVIIHLISLPKLQSIENILNPPEISKSAHALKISHWNPTSKIFKRSKSWISFKWYICTFFIFFLFEMPLRNIFLSSDIIVIGICYHDEVWKEDVSWWHMLVWIYCHRLR